MRAYGRVTALSFATFVSLLSIAMLFLESRDSVTSYFFSFALYFTYSLFFILPLFLLFGFCLAPFIDAFIHSRLIRFPCYTLCGIGLAHLYEWIRHASFIPSFRLALCGAVAASLYCFFSIKQTFSAYVPSNRV
ncbi:hypothetical protein IRY55_04790 [Savagea sp. SN6]|uniref:Uncharacterized protein n=1 Tax=Savagea serpentis TaxID=2785297 RepID=A0A8J7GIW5_9BACL|nr:hypothetical protein [Savagea serpentis]MBF4500675.1 hypothetical protein [Savagea serpentis]